ncbi:hypothetical protein B296_00048912 [Ensete ventricosum]|uniref:Uncharacterized protein n=1 Tax=Ensete ventricosum TaxID=4639 RepID=A0A426WX30_ENSVE|nr:hypothetical protein B296_00048912 [Ensete ventricosum]
MNFNMSKFEVTLPELLNMLREVESAIKKEKPVLYIGEIKKKRKASKILKKRKGKERPDKAKVAKRDRQRIKDSASTTAKMGNGRGTLRTTLQIRRNRSLEKLQVYS